MPRNAQNEQLGMATTTPGGVPTARIGSFALNGLYYDLLRSGAEIWAEGIGPGDPPYPDYAFHRYHTEIITHPAPDDPTRTAVWIEVEGLVCFPGRIGVDISGLATPHPRAG